jgi:hypothetical protein
MEDRPLMVVAGEARMSGSHQKARLTCNAGALQAGRVGPVALERIDALCHLGLAALHDLGVGLGRGVAGRNRAAGTVQGGVTGLVYREMYECLSRCADWADLERPRRRFKTHNAVQHHSSH